MIVAGIDPGISPAYAILSDPDSEEYTYGRIPEIDGWFDPFALRKVLLDCRVDFVVTERVGAISGQGISSSFKFAYSAATIIGVSAGLGIPFTRVTPQKWKKHVLAEYEMGRGTEAVKDVQKKAACDFVGKYYPRIELIQGKRKRVPDHNVAEAVCLAYYGLTAVDRKKITNG